MRRTVILAIVFLSVLTFTAPVVSQVVGPGTLTATSGTVSAATGGILGYQVTFPTGGGGSYILLMSATGTNGFDFGVVQVPLTMDLLVIHTFFSDIGSPVYQFGFRGTLLNDHGAPAYLGFPPGFLTPLVGLTIHLAAIASNTGLLPEYATNPVELVIVP